MDVFLCSVDYRIYVFSLFLFFFNIFLNILLERKEKSQTEINN